MYLVDIMIDIRALFEYNWYCRRKFLESMAKLPWEKVIEDRGASFGSIRNVFLHSLDAEESWLKALASGKRDKESSKGYERSFENIKTMEKYMNDVETESRAALAKLIPAQLDKEFPRGKNKFRIEDLLVHVVEEEIHHRGELICLMWQIDFEPPYKSYMSYLLKE